MLLGLIGLCALLEAVLQLGDLGLLGGPRLRGTAYEYAGFWPQLLDGWGPNYVVQPFTMFVTYSFLHGGAMHLAFNMLALWSLGRAVGAEARMGGMIAIYAAGVVGGAALQGLLSNALQPMVGASGGLFGLAGGLVGWAHAERRDLIDGIRPTIRAIALLLAINLAMWLALDGQLAWQAHLGGFLAGWLAGRAVERVPEAACAAPDR